MTETNKIYNISKAFRSIEYKNKIHIYDDYLISK